MFSPKRSRLPPIFLHFWYHHLIIFRWYNFQKKSMSENFRANVLNYTNLRVYRNLSRHATWHQRSRQIALKQGNQNPQNNMFASFSFTSTAHATQLSNYLTQRAEILRTRRSNLTPRRAKNTVNDLSVVSVVPKSLKASWLHSFLSFFPRPTSYSRQFTPNGCNFG